MPAALGRIGSQRVSEGIGSQSSVSCDVVIREMERIEDTVANAEGSAAGASARARAQ